MNRIGRHAVVEKVREVNDASCHGGSDPKLTVKGAETSPTDLYEFDELAVGSAQNFHA